MKSLTRILRPAGLAAAFSLLAMPALAAQPEDAWITTKVKMALLTDDTVDGLDIDVDTCAGRVTLHGKVDSSVEGVENELQIVPESVAKRVEAQDDQVLAAVRERLESRDTLEDADIDVAVENGVVRLTGTVATQRDRLTALTLARGTDGVGSVVDGLELKRPPG